MQDTKGWVGGVKVAIFVHVYYIKMSLGVGGWSKKTKIMSMWLLNAPYGVGRFKTTSLQTQKNFKSYQSQLLTTLGLRNEIIFI